MEHISTNMVLQMLVSGCSFYCFSFSFFWCCLFELLSLFFLRSSSLYRMQLLIGEIWSFNISCIICLIALMLYRPLCTFLMDRMTFTGMLYKLIILCPPIRDWHITLDCTKLICQFLIEGHKRASLYNNSIETALFKWVVHY